MLKDSILTSKSVGALSDFQFRSWIYLITYVDDFGRGSADPELLKGLVFTRRKGITETQIRNVLDELASFGMIDLYDVDGEPYFCFPNWSKHQRIQTQKSKFPGPDEATEIHREPRKSTVGHRDPPPEIETNKKPNIETETEIETEVLSVSNETDCRNDFRRVMEAWNALGLAKVSRITSGSDRYKQLNRRLKDYGVDEVLRAIGNVSNSDFLMGRTGGQRPFEATFDWFIKPNNFAKVLDGNYANRRRGGEAQSSNPFLDLLEDEYGQK